MEKQKELTDAEVDGLEKQLKPCPICEEKVTFWSRWCNSTRIYSWVECANCRILSYNTSETQNVTLHDVVEDWNNRVVPRYS